MSPQSTTRFISPAPNPAISMFNLSRNVFLISTVMALSFTVISMMVLVTGLLGTAIAADPTLATLPAAMLIVGTAVSTIPAALWMKRVGRKAGMITGILFGITSMLMAYLAARLGHFWLLVAAMFLLGFNAACTQQGRFIILENSSNEKQAADGLTLALLANLFAALVGPWLGSTGRDMVSSPAGFAGSFLLGILVLTVGLLVVCAFTNNRSVSDTNEVSGRPLLVIIRQPAFLIAAGSAAVGYGVMSLVMTATPISMHHFSDHSVDQTRLVIQSHIVAMFLPSLLSGYLVKRGMRFGLLYSGLGLYFLVVYIAQLGIEVVHYWWALVLLGLGWNLLFLTSTALLPTAYRAEERFKTQAANDFLIFTTQAIAAFGAGWLLFHGGWNRIVILSLTVTAVWACTLFVLQRKQAVVVRQ